MSPSGSPLAQAKPLLGVITVVQLAGLACLLGGIILVVHAFSHNSSLAGTYCIIQSGGPNPSCPSQVSYVMPAFLAGVGYAMFMGGFLARFLVLKRFGVPMRSAGMRRRMPPPMMGDLPFGTPGTPTGPPLGPPPGTPGSPFGP